MVEAHSLNSILKHVSKNLPRTVDKLNIKVGETNLREHEQSIGFIAGLNSHEPICSQITHSKEIRNTKLIGILLAHPEASLSKSEITSHLNRFHHRSGEAIDFFCVGYGAYWPANKYPDQKKATEINGVDWFYSDQAFSNVVDELENMTKWTYSGETELLLIAAHKTDDENVKLDFESAIVCNLEAMQTDKAFSTVRAFFEQIFRLAKKQTLENATWGLSDAFGKDVGKTAIKDAMTWSTKFTQPS